MKVRGEGIFREEREESVHSVERAGQELGIVERSVRGFAPSDGPGHTTLRVPCDPGHAVLLREQLAGNDRPNPSGDTGDDVRGHNTPQYSSTYLPLGGERSAGGVLQRTSAGGYVDAISNGAFSSTSGHGSPRPVDAIAVSMRPWRPSASSASATSFSLGLTDGLTWRSATAISCSLAPGFRAHATMNAAAGERPMPARQ